MEISKKVYDVQYSTYISNEIRNATGRDRSASIPYGCPVKGAGKTNTRLPAYSHVLYSSNLVFTKYSLQAVALSACVHGPRSKLREYCRYCTCTFFASRRNYDYQHGYIIRRPHCLMLHYRTPPHAPGEGNEFSSTSSRFNGNV